MSTKRKQHRNTPEVTVANVGRPKLKYTVEDAVKLVSSLSRAMAVNFVMVGQEIDVEDIRFSW
jgi:hypothetical protein